MNIEDHLEKVVRYEELRSRLHMTDDFELRIWAGMNAATNLVNAVLHHLGVTQPGIHFPHQIPGIYVEPEMKGGKWKLVIVPPGDLIHIGFPPIENEIPAVVKPISEALEVIERTREAHIRGDKPISEELLEACDVAYVRCATLARSILAGPAGGNHDA